MCEKVSEVMDKSRGMEYTTRGHREAQKSKIQLEQVSQRNERTDQVNLGRAVTWRGEVRTDRARAEGPGPAEK